jgi:hypothetical protein
MEHSGRRVWHVTEACVVIQQFSEMFSPTLSSHTKSDTRSERQKSCVIVLPQSLKQLGFMDGRSGVGSVWVVGSEGVA